MSFTGLLAHSCSIYRQSGSYDPALTEFGEIGVTWGLVAANVPCRLDTGFTPTNLRREGLVETASLKLFVDSATDIRNWDRIYVNGGYYGVLDVTDVPGMFLFHHKECTVTLIDGVS